MEKLPAGAEPPPDATGSTHLGMLVGSIRANLGWAGHETGDDPWRSAVRMNVRRTIEQILLWSVPLRARVADGRLAIVGAVYAVETGEVEFLDSKPS
jgi:carbonic anhydrase